MPKIEQVSEKTKHTGEKRLSRLGSPVLRNRALLATSISVCTAYAGIGMVVPVRILYAQSRGASLAIIGAMASAYLISNFAFQFPLGWLADRWGRKQVMIASLIAQAALSALYLLITDPITFIGLRFLEGIAGAALLPSARALITDAVPGDQQGEAYGIFGAFFNAGFLLGPGIGGLIASAGYASAFIGAVVFRLLAIVVVLLLIQSEQPQRLMETEQQSAPAAPYSLLFTLPLIASYLIAFGDYLYLGFDQTIMPIWMHDHLGASVAFIGLVYVMFAIPNTILSPIGGRIADRRRRSWLILIFGVGQVPLYLAYGLTTSALVVVILFMVHGVLFAFIQPAIDSHLATSAASSMRARTQGLYSTFGLIGAFIGSIGFGPLYNIDFRFPLFAMGIVYGLCVIIGGLMVRVSEQRKMRLSS